MSIVELKQIISNLFKKPKETIPVVIILIIVAICGFWANGYFGNMGGQAARTKGVSIDQRELPSANDITILGRRALWSNEYLGDRAAYSQLLDWKNSIKDPMTSKLLATEIKRVEDDYRTDIMRENIDRWPLICKPNVDCKEGFENSTGFSAGNVLAHLSPERRMDERARSACLLRNIKTAPDKDSVDKKVFFEKLINSMNEKEPSLCVSKMALATYADLTGFSPNGVFDFEGAIKDWEKRKDEILKINF